MITLFTLPKPFVGPIKTLQMNALRSWKALGNGVEVLLLGRERGVAEAASALQLRHINEECSRNNQGTPLLNWIFEEAQKFATHPTVCYVNTGIILTPTFLLAI